MIYFAVRIQTRRYAACTTKRKTSSQCLTNQPTTILNPILEQQRIKNEKDLEWNKEMHSLIQEMIHARNSLPPETDFAPETVADFERRYHETLRKGASEYKEKPPGKYYPDGFNLCKRMTEYAASHLLFLHDLQVPTNNNLSERKLRNFKRKQKQMISFRSDASLAYTCDGMSTIDRIRSDPEKNLFQEVTKIFER